MKQKKKFFFILSMVLLSCGSQPQPTPLLGDIPSQLSPDEARKVAKLDRKDWVVLDESSAKANEKRRAFDVLTVAVLDYTTLGERGEARFYFFNNQLMATAFYPQDIYGYKKKLEDQKRLKFEFPNSSVLSRILSSILGKPPEDIEGEAVLEAHIAPKTEIRLLRDYRGKDNFYFEDQYLAEKHDQWIRDHS